MKLRAMYDALATGKGKYSRQEFNRMFGRKYESIEDLKLLVNESERIVNKMETLKVPVKEEGLSFSQLLVIVEVSRGIAIEQNTKLYKFYDMYKIELDKWHKT